MRLRIAAVLMLGLFSASAFAQVKEYTLTLRKNRFVPSKTAGPRSQNVIRSERPPRSSLPEQVY